MTVDRKEKEALVALSVVGGLGPARMRALMTELGSARSVLRASADRLMQVRGIGPAVAGEISALRPERVVPQQIDRARRTGARWRTPGETGYPGLLQEIYDPPWLVWSRGRHDIDLEYTIAVVGTRRPTPAGRRFAYDMAYSLSRRGWTVVSGLAYGIDAAAHRGALDAGAPTVAVLGCGVDVVYPAPNRRLFSRILREGLLLSEFPMGASPDATNFPRRNRLISGMSRGVVLVETFESGGGLITARFALEQNREVFAVPGVPRSAASLGCNRLIQRGEAKLVLDVDDVEAEFASDLPPSPPEARPAPKEANERQDPLLAHLSAEPLHIEELSTRSGLGIAELQSRLMMLEISGMVRQMPGKRFYLRRE